MLLRHRRDMALVDTLIAHTVMCGQPLWGQRNVLASFQMVRSWERQDTHVCAGCQSCWADRFDESLFS